MMKKQLIQVHKTQIECVIVRKPDCAQFYLKTDFNRFPLRTYFEIYCQQTYSEHRGIKTFEKTSVVSMDLDCAQLNQVDELSLSIYFDPGWFQKPQSKIHRFFRYQWTLSESQLDYIKSSRCTFGKSILSDNFDADHWYLRLAPKGGDFATRDSVCLYLVLLALRTSKIYMMDVQYTLESSYNGISEQMVKTFYAMNTESDTFLPHTFPSDVLHSLHELSFTVTIEILSIYDDNGRNIKFSSYVQA
eukprot:CAMPEP_0197074972 /NCGR_PEP_ID=MMETSP1384-20130603/211378_1 /TAXON_ID=29189 /ORGANISM="Ammonia sp." /LENGTH=245 /DNA_ID=CAMNT_0042513815 /DNA_START=42 /DNA_END=782 /DNA_ORIENTATION=-